MISRRLILSAAIVTACVTGGLPSRAAPAPADAPGVVRAFYDALTATMKEGANLGFTGRRDRLKPAVAKAFDLAQMTQLAVGPRWQSLSSRERSDLIAAFGDYSAAIYATRFTKYEGERFEVDADSRQSEFGLIVHTKLIDSKGDPVQLDYLMKPGESGWEIVDVYLNGTVSQLATTRSEFSAVLDRGGAPALIDALSKKAADMSG